MTEEQIYLDYNATTPLDKNVIEAMLPYLYGRFGNPSSSHRFGVEAKVGVEKARSQIASMLGCETDEIIFTSGGSESNNLALKGIALANRGKGNHIITTTIEHPAVLEVCRYLEKNEFIVAYLDVDEFGRVNPEDLLRSIKPETILISVMHANNEVGTIQPLKEISEVARSHNILFHTDAAQSVGKIPVRIDDLGVDLLSIAGHKVYAPKGIGVLYVRHGTNIEKIIHGAGHERNMRAGTENVLEIVGLGEACKLVGKNLVQYSNHFQLMRDSLEKAILDTIAFAKVNGDKSNRLPNTSSISFKGIEANKILSNIKRVALSAGAACHTDRIDISHVLQAMRIPRDFAMGTIRISTGRQTTLSEIEITVNEINQAVNKLSQ